MTITIDVSPQDAEQLAYQAERAGQDLPSYLHEALQRMAFVEKPAMGFIEEHTANDPSSFFGMWKDRKDISDSEVWVAQERATWSNRYNRQD